MEGVFFFISNFLKITAICSAGVGNDPIDNREDSRQHLLGDSTDAMDCNVEMMSNSSKITAVLFVGISVDEVYFFLLWWADISGLLWEKNNLLLFLRKWFLTRNHSLL